MKSPKHMHNTRLYYPICNIQTLHLTVNKPQLDAYFVNWLTQRGIDVDDVIKAFFSVVDPDGNDEDYFDLFEDYFRRAGFDSEDPEYIQVNYVCQRILEILLAQFNYTQAFSFLMIGSLMDVNVEDTYVVLTIKFEE